MKEFNFTRKDFEAIHKMDRKDTESYIRKVRNEAYEAAKAESYGKKTELDMKELQEEIQKLKGIGGVKARRVVEVIEGLLNKEA